MKLNEIKKIEAVKPEALATIKGGGRDTRNDAPVGPSTYTDFVDSTSSKSTKKP